MPDPRVRQPHHHHPLLRRAHRPPLDRTLTRNRDRTHPVAEGCALASEGHVRDPRPRLHPPRHRSRPPRPRSRRRRTLRPPQRPSSMHTMPQSQDATRSSTRSSTTTQVGAPPPPHPSPDRRGDAVENVLYESGRFGPRRRELTLRAPRSALAGSSAPRSGQWLRSSRTGIAVTG